MYQQKFSTDLKFIKMLSFLLKIEGLVKKVIKGPKQNL